MVGVFVDLRGFISFSPDDADPLMAALLRRVVERATETGSRHGLSAVKSENGGILFVAPDEESALEGAFALSEAFTPEHGYLPVHVAMQRGGVLELEDSVDDLKLAARVTVAAHPGDVRPASRR